MARRRRKKKNFKYVLFIIIIFIMAVGGIFVWKNLGNKDNFVVEKKNKVDISVNKDLDKAPSNYQEFLKFSDGEYITDKGFTLSIKNGLVYIDDLLIVNKTYSLPDNYKPENAYESVSGERCNNCIDKEVMSAFKSMQSDANGLGLNIYIASGYRSYSYQEKLYNNYVSVSGKEVADTYSARPGHSEHQSGFCFDLNTVDDSFANTREGKWINENASNYGFVIRYPKGKERVTGYQYESWHLRYVGRDLASKLYNNGDWITLEEYYGISSSYE